MKLQAKTAVLALAAALTLSACSVLEGDKIDYKSAGKAPSLQIPPDLTQLSRESRYVVPASGSVTASAYQGGLSAPTGSTMAPTSLADARVERAGTQRWLVINRTPEQLWSPVRDFWQENGFLLAQDQATLGIMETDWAENRAKIPQDFIRSTLGKLIDQAYSTSERDRFRTRMERAPGGGTEIYISHRGLQEVYTTNNRDRTIWQPRPADPELEAEFLRRLMVKLGLPAEQSKGLVATATSARPTSRVATVGGTPVVQLDEAFDRAWRRVGLALDRTGFSVEDRDRSQGTYFVRYVEPSTGDNKPGFFAKMFGADSSAPPVKYRISVKSDGPSTTVAVLSSTGAPESSATAQRILQIIADDLK